MNTVDTSFSVDPSGGSSGGDTAGVMFRLFSWSIIALMAAFLVNNYLIVWQEMPNISAFFKAIMGDSSLESMHFIVPGIYLISLILAVVFTYRTQERSLRFDAQALHGINLYIVRAAFWAVLLIGLVDATISFMRVEGFLPILGEQLASDLGRSQWRGPYIHLPLVLLGIIVALRSRTLGFHWLALLVVIAELLIVLGRFVFSYEQTFMSDLVRFWYAALFLLSSAYTLYEDGHVRVDIVYAGLSDMAKGWVNAIGSLVLGASLCWVILLVALNGKTSIVNTALLRFETSQSGFGMYIKYWMASFLVLFAITMLVQFLSAFLEGIADIRQEPGKRKQNTEIAH